MSLLNLKTKNYFHLICLQWSACQEPICGTRLIYCFDVHPPYVWRKKSHNHGIYTSDGPLLNPNEWCSKSCILDIFDDALFLTYHNFIETRFNKVYINVNISNGYKVFHQPKMSIISIISHYLGTIYEKPPQTTLRGIFVEHRTPFSRTIIFKNSFISIW